VPQRRHDNGDSDSDKDVKFISTSKPNKDLDNFSESENTDVNYPETIVRQQYHADDQSVTIVESSVSTDADGTPLAQAWKPQKKITLSELEDSDMSSPQSSPQASPTRFHKGKDKRDNFLPRDNVDHVAKAQKNLKIPDKMRYSLRSKGAPTTGAPEGGCSP